MFIQYTVLLVLRVVGTAIHFHVKITTYISTFQILLQYEQVIQLRTIYHYVLNPCTEWMYYIISNSCVGRKSEVQSATDSIL
jgi:hypothetical protein